MSSPTQRTLKVLKDRGYKTYITEKWIRIPGRFGIRKDAFGFGDILAFNVKTKEIALVQACAGASHANRKKKILGIPEAKEWIEAGGKILLMSFRKNAKRRYDMREEFITFKKD